MELHQVKQLISEAKNICLIPSGHGPEGTTATLALFYTLRELGKNVNLILDSVEEKFNFLVPSLDFISQPKDFVISIPKNAAEISQVYFEKNEEQLKIHLTVEKGHLQKDSISLYVSEAKPDLIITLGLQDFRRELEGKLDSYGFLLDTPIINVDSQVHDNKRFGRVNIVQDLSISETLHQLIKTFGLPANTNVSKCLLAGLTLYYENFQSPKAGAAAFELSAELMKNGADRQEIARHLYQNPQKDLSAGQEKPLNIVTS